MADMFKSQPAPSQPHIPELPHQRGLTVAGKYGHDILWVVFAIQLIGGLVFMAMSLRVAAKNRLFYHITSFITFFAAISYYCMATGIGAELVPARGHFAFREVLWARYADWAVTTPLLLLDLALFSGLGGLDIVLLMIADLSMIATGLIAALHPSTKYRWGLYAFSCAFLIYILWTLIVTSYNTATMRSKKVGNAYLMLGAYTAVLWSAYPIVWALSEGTNYLKADTEILLYAILDVLAKVAFGGLLLVFHTQIAESGVTLPDSFVKPRGASGAVRLSDD